jgi:hypothetical protein
VFLSLFLKNKKKIMKKIIAAALIIQSLPYLQTLDINSLRMAQRQISKSSPQLSSITSNTSDNKPFLIDKSISPKQYKVGPGDQIHINIISSNETFDYSLMISPTGVLLIPSVGLINTDNLSLHELIKKIKNKIESWNLNAQVNIEIYLKIFFRIILKERRIHMFNLIIEPTQKALEFILKLQSMVSMIEN